MSTRPYMVSDVISSSHIRPTRPLRPRQHPPVRPPPPDAPRAARAVRPALRPPPAWAAAAGGPGARDQRARGGGEGGGGGARVSLFLEARGLSRTGRGGGRGDTFCVVERRAGERFAEVDATETVFNNLCPQWAKRVDLSYEFGVPQVLRFSVYHRCEKGGGDGSGGGGRSGGGGGGGGGGDGGRELLGSATYTVAALMVLADRGSTALALARDRGRSAGQLLVRAEELRADLDEAVTLQFACMTLRNARNPFYRVRRAHPDGGWATVKYSEVHRTYRPAPRVLNTFKAFPITLLQLCNGDKARRLQVEFLEYCPRGRHALCGAHEFTLAELERDFRVSSESGHAPVYRLRKTGVTGRSVFCGHLAVMACSVSTTVSFLDYVSKGNVIIKTVFAVDMSSTNGNPADPASRQYNNPAGPNEYEEAIRQVGRVLAEYDSAQTFPAYGISACLPPTFEDFSHCFSLTDSPGGICAQIDGVVDAYRDKLATVAPHMPCQLGPVVRKVVAEVKKEDVRSDHGVYTVLVLLTDGDFCDYDDVADAVVAAADLPLSIVIVGIGADEKPLLEKLDGDEVRLCDRAGIPASRDIVQYVPFHKHRGNPARLSEEVLCEIPEQLVSYFRSQGIRPGDERRPPPAVLVPSSAAQSTSDSDEAAAASDDMLNNFSLGGRAASDPAVAARDNYSPLSRANSNDIAAHGSLNNTFQRTPSLSSSTSTVTGVPTPMYPRAAFSPSPLPTAPSPAGGSAPYHADSYGLGSMQPLQQSLSLLQPSYPAHQQQQLASSHGHSAQTGGWTPALPASTQAHLSPVASPMYSSSGVLAGESVYEGPTMQPLSGPTSDAPAYLPEPPSPAPGPPVELGNSYSSTAPPSLASSAFYYPPSPHGVQGHPAPPQDTLPTIPAQHAQPLFSSAAPPQSTYHPGAPGGPGYMVPRPQQQYMHAGTPGYDPGPSSYAAPAPGALGGHGQPQALAHSRYPAQQGHAPSHTQQIPSTGYASQGSGYQPGSYASVTSAAHYPAPQHQLQPTQAPAAYAPAPGGPYGTTGYAYGYSQPNLGPAPPPVGPPPPGPPRPVQPGLGPAPPGI